jgi:hypothetical protein
MKSPQKLKTGLIELICQLFVRFVSFLTYHSGLLSRTCMASEASKLNDQNAEARSTYRSSRRSLFRAIGPGGFEPGRLNWVARRLSGTAAHGGWHATAGCGRAVDQRLNTEFLISAVEFIDISTARVRIFWPFLQVGQIISWNFLPAEFYFFLPKANVGTVVPRARRDVSNPWNIPRSHSRRPIWPKFLFCLGRGALPCPNAPIILLGMLNVFHGTLSSLSMFLVILPSTHVVPHRPSHHSHHHCRLALHNFFCSHVLAITHDISIVPCHLSISQILFHCIVAPLKSFLAPLCHPFSLTSCSKIINFKIKPWHLHHHS